MEKSKTKSRSKIIIRLGSVAAAVIVATVLLSSNNAILFGSNSPSNTNTHMITIGDIAPDFSLTDPQKGQITKETFAGKPLVIYFMATWCSSCYIGVGNLASYYDQSDKNFNVLRVSADGTDTENKLAQFNEVFGRQGWYIASGVHNMVNTYHVTLLDTKYLIDKDGIIKWKGSEILDADSMGKVMKQVLGV